MDGKYRIREGGELIAMDVAGRLTLPLVAAMDADFWNAYRTRHTRILMDWSAVTDVAIQVRDFTDAGLADRERRPQVGDGVRAAYVASDPLVKAYAGMIERIWSSHLDVRVSDTLAPALAWLGVDVKQLDTLDLRATG